VIARAVDGEKQGWRARSCGPPALRRFLGAAAAAGPAKHRPEGFARKVPSCGVARLVEQNERSTFVARLASEHFSCKRGSQRVLHQPATSRSHKSYTSCRAQGGNS